MILNPGTWSTFESDQTWAVYTNTCKCGKDFNIYVNQHASSLGERRAIIYHGFTMCGMLILTSAQLDAANVSLQVDAAYDMVSKVEAACEYGNDWYEISKVLAKKSAALKEAGL